MRGFSVRSNTISLSLTPFHPYLNTKHGYRLIAASYQQVIFKFFLRKVFLYRVIVYSVFFPSVCHGVFQHILWSRNLQQATTFPQFANDISSVENTSIRAFFSWKQYHMVCPMHRNQHLKAPPSLFSLIFCPDWARRAKGREPDGMRLRADPRQQQWGSCSEDVAEEWIFMICYPVTYFKV